MLKNLHKQQVALGGVALKLTFYAYLPETDDRLYDVRGFNEPVTLTGREVALNSGETTV